MSAPACAAEGCEVLVSPGPVMCARHLALLPRLLREQLWSYRGREPAPEVVQAAIATVAERERAGRGEQAESPDTSGEWNPAVQMKRGT